MFVNCENIKITGICIYQNNALDAYETHIDYNYRFFQVSRGLSQFRKKTGNFGKNVTRKIRNGINFKSQVQIKCSIITLKVDSGIICFASLFMFLTFVGIILFVFF